MRLASFYKTKLLKGLFVPVHLDHIADLVRSCRPVHVTGFAARECRGDKLPLLVPWLAFIQAAFYDGEFFPPRLVVLSKRLEAGVNTKDPFSHPGFRIPVFASWSSVSVRILWVIFSFPGISSNPRSRLSCSNSMLFMFLYPYLHEDELFTNIDPRRFRIKRTVPPYRFGAGFIRSLTPPSRGTAQALPGWREPLCFSHRARGQCRGRRAL